jgi:hypothetical protein
MTLLQQCFPRQYSDLAVEMTYLDNIRTLLLHLPELGQHLLMAVVAAHADNILHLFFIHWIKVGILMLRREKIRKLEQHMHTFFVYFFGGLECMCRPLPIAYVAYL